MSEETQQNKWAQPKVARGVRRHVEPPLWAEYRSPLLWEG
jgi:hypothetical protein